MVCSPGDSSCVDHPSLPERAVFDRAALLPLQVDHNSIPSADAGCGIAS
jgi:hypothetical protein